MTPEQLEAHRVRFEQQFYAVYGFEPCRSGPAYGEGAACDAWQLYQRVLADADRAQRAAQPPQQVEQSAEFAGWQHRVYYTDNNDPGWSNWREVLECDMGTIQKLSREYPQRHQMRPVYTAPQQSAQPVAAANGWAKGLEIRMSQGWKLKGGICPVLYSDTVNGYGVGRDDLWLATTDALKSAQPVEVQRVPLTDATQFEKDVARWMEKDGLTREQAECEVNYRTTRKALKSGLSAHGIKPTSSEGGA